MNPLLQRISIVAVTLVLAGGAGHYLTLSFLNSIKIIPKNHDAHQRDISKWIGISERIVVALLVLCNAVAATVFVFATKAALVSTRIPEGSSKSKREVTEYILIGTLVSYFFGLFFGLTGRMAPDLIEQFVQRQDTVTTTPMATHDPESSDSAAHTDRARK